MNPETDVITQTTARLEEATFPPYHPFHGTNQTMRWRRVTFEMRGATAVFEQTDYGHPGRLNPWTPRGVHVSLAPRVPQLEAAATAIAAIRA